MSSVVGVWVFVFCARTRTRTRAPCTTTSVHVCASHFVLHFVNYKMKTRQLQAQLGARIRDQRNPSAPVLHQNGMCLFVSTLFPLFIFDVPFHSFQRARQTRGCAKRLSERSS